MTYTLKSRDYCDIQSIMKQMRDIHHIDHVRFSFTSNGTTLNLAMRKEKNSDGNYYLMFYKLSPRKESSTLLLGVPINNIEQIYFRIQPIYLYSFILHQSLLMITVKSSDKIVHFKLQEYKEPPDAIQITGSYVNEKYEEEGVKFSSVEVPEDVMDVVPDADI
jgi:hypothetical protein